MAWIEELSKEVKGKDMTREERRAYDRQRARKSYHLRVTGMRDATPQKRGRIGLKVAHLKRKVAQLQEQIRILEEIGA